MKTKPPIIPMHLRLLSLLCLLLGGTPLAAMAEKPRPNIVLIMSDDHSWYDVGFMGNKDVRTPHLDRLAGQGKVFTQIHTSTSVCSPSRYQIQTGRFPHEARFYGNSPKVVRTMQFETLPTVLGRLGYRTVLAGKRHLEPESHYPYEFLTSNSSPDEETVEAVRKFLSEPPPQPFLCVVTFRDPHTGWPTEIYDPADPVTGVRKKSSRFAEPTYDPSTLAIPSSMADTPITRRNLAAYYEKVNRLDQNIGRVLEALAASPFKDNTLVIWTSEQGMQTPRGKWTCYDLGLRTATVAYWPGVIPAGSRSDALIQYADFLPTLNELAGGEPVPGVEGKSFLPVLMGQADAFRDEVYGATFGFFSVRDSHYKYIWNSKKGEPFKHMFMSDFANESTELYQDLLAEEKKGNAKAIELLTWLRNPPHEELYDLQADPFEINNLAANSALAQTRDAMRERLRLWLTAQKDPAVDTLNSDFPPALSN